MSEFWILFALIGIVFVVLKYFFRKTEEEDEE